MVGATRHFSHFLSILKLMWIRAQIILCDFPSRIQLIFSGLGRDTKKKFQLLEHEHGQDFKLI